MKLIALAAGLLITASIPAKAQEAPPVEVFGGYSFFRSDGGGSLHGWNVSIAGNLSRWFGLVGDLSGHYGARSLRAEFSGPGFPVTFPVTITTSSNSYSSQYLFLFGPRFSYRKNPRVTLFAHALMDCFAVNDRYLVALSR